LPPVNDRPERRSLDEKFGKRSGGALPRGCLFHFTLFHITNGPGWLFFEAIV
jgi:hypothetical protein